MRHSLENANRGFNKVSGKWERCKTGMTNPPAGAPVPQGAPAMHLHLPLHTPLSSRAGCSTGYRVVSHPSSPGNYSSPIGQGRRKPKLTKCKETQHKRHIRKSASCVKETFLKTRVFCFPALQDSGLTMNALGSLSPRQARQWMELHL